MSKKKKILYNNKGITGIDLTLSVIVLTTFVGIIICLMVNSDYVKKVTIIVSYVVNNQRKDINISKLKIKEI